MRSRALTGSWGAGEAASIDVETRTGAVTDTGATVIAWQPRGYAPVMFPSSADLLASGAAV